MAVRRDCAVDDCDAAAKSLGWCPKHYSRWRRTGDPLRLSSRTPGEWARKFPAGAVCAVTECERILDGTGSRGMCGMHYTRWRLHGDVNHQRKTGRRACSIAGCGLPQAGRTWCSAHWSNWSRYGSPQPRLTCLACGQSFAPSRDLRKYCTRECADLATLVRARGYSARRRALKRATQVEPVDTLAIYARDQWVCRLCETALDPDIAWPEPMSASLDHVVPLILGGAHVADNLQAAHLVCNIRKGGKLQREVA